MTYRHSCNAMLITAYHALLKGVSTCCFCVTSEFLVLLVMQKNRFFWEHIVCTTCFRNLDICSLFSKILLLLYYISLLRSVYFHYFVVLTDSDGGMYVVAGLCKCVVADLASINLLK